jgi:hypothetical protein
VCLKRATPENIERKSWLVERLEGMVRAEPKDEAWRGQVAPLVDELDDLERPFAQYDRVRFGGPVSRDRLITAIRTEHLREALGASC